MFKAKFDGLSASPSLWRALGASEAYPYTNGDGPVRWHMAGSGGGTSEAYALELLTRAREECGTGAGDESIVARAVVLRGRDRTAAALLELGRGLLELASRGMRLSASVGGQIAHLVEVVQ